MSLPSGAPAADLPPPIAGSTQPRRVTSITPIVKGLQAAAVVAAAVFFAVADQLVDLGGWLIPTLLALFAVAALITSAFSYLAWTRLTYWFDDDGDFRLRSGVVTTKERRLQLSRLQSVDVQQPILARIFGLGVVSIEVAGSGDSRASLQYLTLPQAEALRAEVLARAAGLRPDTETAPERILVQVPGRQLAQSLVLRGSTVALFLLTAAIATGTVMTSGPAGLLTLLLVGVPLFAVVAEFASLYGFTVAESPDGLRTRAGLLTTRSQTIPPGRVHAVEFVQSLLWRRWGWVRVRLNVAGLQREEENSGGVETQSVLLPVASWALAREIVGKVMPGVDIDGLPWQAAPPRARRRAWIQHRNLAYATTAEVFAARVGRLVLRIGVMPHERIQSVRVTQGPWERLLGLATVHADSVPGPVGVKALYRDAADARTIVEAENAALLAAQQSARPARWMSTPPEPQIEDRPERGSEVDGVDS